MIAYYFTNMYLSSIQHGIQALHCTQEMNVKYGIDNTKLNDWGKIHKTVRLLNGGTSDDMAAIKHLMEHPENEFPWAYFNEPSLDNALTCVGIIVPPYIYERQRSDIGSFEYELCQLVHNKHSAR